MKKSFIVFAGIIFILISCENDKSDPANISDSSKGVDQEVLFKIGTSLSYKYNDIDMYDSSAHVLYFKTNHPEFDKNSSSTFCFFINSDTIYKGDFWSSFRSDLPTKPYISSSPFWLQNYALWIENRDNIKPDLRNDPTIIKALKDRSILHSGLLVTINSIQCSSSQINFSFKLTNKDQSSLLFLDPEKMGLNLFHYFTNGLIFKLPNSGSTTIRITAQSPSPYNSWKNEWLSSLSPGESKDFTIIYPITSPMSAGEYNVTFTFPGLSSQIYSNQLNQANGRIWLGSFKASKSIVVN
jgi:hypothetical protein